jgi:predicted AlkP superfamily pyrophosphatase or phosphodiesterase
MKFKFLFNLVYLFIFLGSLEQAAQQPKQSKLIIGIVIDQMRYDYLTKFADRYGKE